MNSSFVALIVGGNRGIGLGVVKDYLARGASVIATARQPDQATDLAALAAAHPGRLDIMGLDMSDPPSLERLAAALADRTVDALLLNAGIAGPAHRSANAATVAETGSLMFVNAIAPVRLARLLLERVRKDTGVVAFTSSVMGSVALNQGGHELYRASKAALNSLTRGFASEAAARGVTVLTLHPGWVRTDMGGASAPVSVSDSARGMVEVMSQHAGGHRHLFLDYAGKELAW